MQEYSEALIKKRTNQIKDIWGKELCPYLGGLELILSLY